MKDEILAKVKQLDKVTLESYFKNDGTNYQQLCKELYVLIDEAIENEYITAKEYIVICEELKKIADKTKGFKKQVEDIFNKSSQNFQSN